MLILTLIQYMIFLPHLPGISMSSFVTKHGEDTSRLKPYCTRAAAATKSLICGLTVVDVVKAADWSSAGVFQKFYYRPQYRIKIGTVVLVASASKSHVVMETKSSEV